MNSKTLTGVIGILVLSILYTACAGFLVFHVLHISRVNAESLYFTRFILWIYLGLLLVYCRQIEQRPLLIWQEKKYRVSTYFLYVLALLVILFIGSVLINLMISLTGHHEKSARMQEIITILKTNRLLLVFTALTAGIVEEFIFRGYLQPRFELIFKKPWIAILLSGLTFGLLHITYGTLRNVIVPVFIGFIFAWYYYTYRNIKVLILCHFLWDFIVLTSQMN